MKKIIILLSIIIVFALVFIVFKFTIFSDNAAKIYTESFLKKNNINIKYDRASFKISFSPTLILYNLNYNDVLKCKRFEIVFPFSFYLNREKKPEEIIVKDGNFSLLTDSKFNVLSLYDLLKPDIIKIVNSKLFIGLENKYLKFNIIINSIIFDLNRFRYFVNVDLKDLQLKNNFINFAINKNVIFYSSLKKYNDKFIIDKKSLEIDGEKEEVSISYLDKVLNIIFSYKKTNFLISNFFNKLSFNIKGYNRILGDYELDLGLISKFLDMKLEFTNNFNNESEFRGLLKGNISVESSLDSLQKSDIKLRVHCNNISNKNENFPVQLDGIVFVKDNILYAENLKVGVGKSFFKIGGQITKFTDFVYSVFLSDDFDKSQGVFLFTSQNFDMLELSQKFKYFLYNNEFFKFLPNTNIEMNIDFNGFSIGEVHFSNGIGSIKLKDKNIKSYLKPISSNGNYSLTCTCDYSSLDMVKLSNFVFIRNVSLKKILSTYFDYTSNNRAVANITYNIEVLLNSLEKKIDKFFITGKINAYSGYVSNDRFFNSISQKLRDDRFKIFNFKYFNFNLFYDYLNKDFKINNFSFSSGSFNIRGNIKQSRTNKLNFIGNFFVLPENYNKWNTLSGFKFDPDLKLYVLPLDFEF